MKKVIVVTGPTASGKSKLGLELAKALNTAIISIDSVQVYKRLDIGSAKPTLAEQKEVKHYLVDFLDPKEKYDVSSCQKDVRDLISKIDMPLLVGGTGLYIKAILTDYDFNGPKRDDSFSLKYQDYSNESLYEILKQKDYKASLKIHPNNRKRVLRALEVLENGTLFSSKDQKDKYLYEPYIIYLDSDRNTLYERINQRVLEMVNLGLEEEVRSLYNDNVLIDAIGYKEWYPYFKGEITKEEVIENIMKNTRHLAKRQRTWFLHQLKVNFYQVDYDNFNELVLKVIKDVKEFLK